MIFGLQCTVDDLSGTSKAQLEAAFSALIDADRSGRHFFVVGRELGAWASSNLQLSGRDLAHLKGILEGHTTRAGLLDVARARVSVTIGHESITIRGKDSYSIGHQCLIEGQYLLSKGCLVTENSSFDGELYEHILAEARQIAKVPSISVQRVHGGGTGTDLVFDQTINEHKVVVCIVDRDSSAPMDRISPTARKVERIYQEKNLDCNNPEQRFIGLGVLTIGRELENYIPYHLFKVMGNFGSYGCFRELDQLVSEAECVEPNSCFWQYFDIKKGISGEKIARKKANGEISADVLHWICETVGLEPETVDECRIAGFGSDVVGAFFASHEALSGFHRFVRSEYWRCTFGAYFERLLWYFAAPTQIRT